MVDQSCNSEILKINIKDVLNFCYCPNYYDLKHRTANECGIKEAYDRSLHDCFYTYLHALENGTLEGAMDFLKYHWGRKWIGYKTKKEIVLTPSSIERDGYESKRKQGIEAIITFRKLMDTPQFPIIINKPYEVPITKNIILTGIWEYVREIKGEDGERVFQIMKFKTEGNRFQVNGQTSHDLELTAASLAFQYNFKVPKKPELAYMDIYKKHIIRSYRTEKDYKMLKKSIISVACCLKNQIRCVSPDKKCFHCDYRKLCLK